MAPKPHEENPGCKKCTTCMVSCPILKEGATFRGSNTGRTYRIKQKLDCNSSFVIYLATCRNVFFILHPEFLTENFDFFWTPCM